MLIFRRDIVCCKIGMRFGMRGTVVSIQVVM